VCVVEVQLRRERRSLRCFSAKGKSVEGVRVLDSLKSFMDRRCNDAKKQQRERDQVSAPIIPGRGRAQRPETCSSLWELWECGLSRTGPG
jgi:hypothetical protein